LVRAEQVFTHEIRRLILIKINNHGQSKSQIRISRFKL